MKKLNWVVITGCLATILIGITGIVLTVNKSSKPTQPEVSKESPEKQETLRMLQPDDINQLNGIVTKEDDDRPDEQLIAEYKKENPWKDAIDDVFTQHQNFFQDETTYDFRNLEGYKSKCTREEVIHARNIYDMNLRDCGWIFTKKAD